MVFIKSDDGSLAEFNSPLYLEEASYDIEKMEGSRMVDLNLHITVHRIL